MCFSSKTRLFTPNGSTLFHLFYIESFIPGQQHCAELFCSLAVLDPRVGHTMDVLSPFMSMLFILIDSSTESPVHDLMLSIQAVRGLPRLRTPGIVPCIISFSRQFPCFLIV